ELLGVGPAPGAGMSDTREPASVPLILAGELASAGGGVATAAAVAVAIAGEGSAVLAELGAPGRRPPTLLASAAARALEDCLRRARGEAGQALGLALGAAFAVLACALVMVTLGGAITGAGRIQRAADLAALSGARSLRDDVPALAAPERLGGGAGNPAHLDRA